jgi:membrane protease YdiL (CAAX protease family)
MTPTSNVKLVVLFICLVLLVSWGYEAFIIVSGGVARFGLAGLVILMWIPGLLSILLRLTLTLGFRDVRFIPGGPRYYLYAVSIPLVLALLTALLCVILDIRQLTLIGLEELQRTVPTFLSLLAIGLFGAFGEELGWRGFLLPKMVAAGIPHPYLASGLVWAVWHLPLIAFGGFYQTTNTFAMAFAYGMSIVAINFVISEMRMRSQSVWVATLLHASHNFFFQLAVPVLVLTESGRRSELWEIVGGDSGIIVAVLYMLTFFLGFRVYSNKSTGGVRRSTDENGA